MRAAAMALALAGSLAGCAKPVPAEKAEYVGTWQGPQMTLTIHAGGRVLYARRRGNTATSVDAPLKRFENEDFIVGVGPLETRFDVTRPPHRAGGAWRITVDGVELTRTAR